VGTVRNLVSSRFPRDQAVLANGPLDLARATCMSSTGEPGLGGARYGAVLLCWIGLGDAAFKDGSDPDSSAFGFDEPDLSEVGCTGFELHSGVELHRFVREPRRGGNGPFAQGGACRVATFAPERGSRS
jgi:hypothetical protein